MPPTIAVLLPAYNEATTIQKVITDFRAQLPDARIVVYDNNSTDGTADLALAAGAEVRREKRQGKGNVVQAMFRDIDADVYVMADADDTYPADAVHDLLAPVLEGRADMTVGNRLKKFGEGSFRRLHHTGNRFVVGLINLAFRAKVRDVMSGYRAFTKRLAKTVPLLMPEFEVETEMTIQSLHRGFRIEEVPIPYGERPEGSESKLRTFRDGYRILMTIALLMRDLRPLLVFSLLAVLAFLLGSVLGLSAVSAAWFPNPDGPEGAFGGQFLVVLVAGAVCIVCSVVLAVGGLVINAVLVRSKEQAAIQDRLTGPGASPLDEIRAPSARNASQEPAADPDGESA